MEKLNCKVYTHVPRDGNSDIYDRGEWTMLTEVELGQQCCVWHGDLYFKKSLPEDILKYELDEYDATPHDIWNYDCFNWRSSDVTTKQIIQRSVDRHNEIRASLRRRQGESYFVNKVKEKEEQLKKLESDKLNLIQEIAGLKAQILFDKSFIYHNED